MGPARFGPAATQPSLLESRLSSENTSAPSRRSPATSKLDAGTGEQLEVVRIARDVADEADIDEDVDAAGLGDRRGDQVGLGPNIAALDDVALDRDASEGRERRRIDGILLTNR